MPRWLKYAGVCFAAFIAAFIYFTLFGPLLGAAFASTAFVAALGAVIALERLGLGSEQQRRRRVAQFFAAFLFLGAFFDPMDRCLDRGGSWNWYSAHCDRR